MLHWICQQIWKTQQWPQNWKMSVFIPISKKTMPKKVQTIAQLHSFHTVLLISHASQIMFKILQARLQQYMNWELSDVQAGFRKGRGTTSASLTILKPLTVWITTNWKILEETGITDHLTCLLRNLYAGQEATVRTRHGTMDWFQIGKGVCQGCILSPCLFNLYASFKMSGWMKHKLESRLQGEILITSDMQMTPFLWQKVKRNYKASYWKRRVKQLA